MVKELLTTTTCIDLEKEKNFYVNIDNGILCLNNICDDVLEINIINYLGKMVAEFSPNSDNMYNISELHSGIYFIIVKTNNKIHTKKFIVVR
jgi:hypothetical protein